MHTRSQRVEDDSVANISARRDGVERSAECAAYYLELSTRESSSVVNLCVCACVCVCSFQCKY